MFKREWRRFWLFVPICAALAGLCGSAAWPLLAQTAKPAAARKPPGTGAPLPASRPSPASKRFYPDLSSDYWFDLPATWEGHEMRLEDWSLGEAGTFFCNRQGRRERELNATYRAVRARLSAARREQLRQDELRWIKWRDQGCEAYAKEEYGNGSEGRRGLCQCYEAGAIQRIAKLKTYK